MINTPNANKVISAARSSWYSIYEPLRLKEERRGFPWWREAPKVSVIIPTHNRAQLLHDRALESVRKQTYGHLEIIVAAHGCTDETHRMMKGVMADDKRVRLLDVPRNIAYPPTPENHWFAGPVDPLNAALEICEGDWIARLDDDDIWTETHIEDLLEFAQKGSYEFVSSRHATLEDFVDPYEIGGVKIGGCQTWLYRSYLKFMKYNPDCWRKTWDKVNDTDLQKRMVNAGVRMGYLDKVTAVILPRPGEKHIGLKAA